MKSRAVEWLPDPYSARNRKSLGTKDSVRAVDLRDPYFLHWNDHTLDFTWGERPAVLPGGRPLTQRQLEAYRNHQARVSPLMEARRFQAELGHAAVRSKAEVARRFGVSRVRVVQYLNLLTLDPRIIEFLDAHFGDPLIAATFTERRLRELLATTTPSTQWSCFQKMLHEARSQPGVWSQPNGKPH